MLLHPDASYYQSVIINYLHAQNSEQQLVKKTKNKTPFERCVTPTMDDSVRTPDYAKHPRAKREQDLNLRHPSNVICPLREWIRREEKRNEIHKEW